MKGWGEGKLPCIGWVRGVYPNLPIEEVRGLLNESFPIEEVKSYGTNRIAINDISNLDKLRDIIVKCFDAVVGNN